MTARDSAWAALHDATTDAASLGAIAQDYPEFAEAILRHPNCYDGLREWIATYAHSTSAFETPASGLDSSINLPAVGTRKTMQSVLTVPVAHDRHSEAARLRPMRSRTGLLIGVISAAVVVIVGGGVWAFGSMPRAGGDGDASSAAPGGLPASQPQRTLSGAPVYIGDELEWLLLDDGQVHTYFPDSGQVVSDNTLFTYGEGEGAHTDPGVCIDWLMPDIESAIGTRSRKWTATGSAIGTMQVLQFPSAEMATLFYRARADTVANCAAFQTLGSDGQSSSSTTLTRLAGEEGAMVIDQVATATSGGSTDRTTRALLQEGNLVVDITAPRSASDVVDPDGLLAAISARADAARVRLTDQIGYR